MRIEATSSIVHVVDDDILIRDSLRTLLESDKQEVKVYDDGETFLRDFDHCQQGCILLDVRMPKMSGLEVLEKLVENSNHLPVIIITGHGDISIAVRAMKLGALDFLTKPTNETELLEKVNSAIRHNNKSQKIRHLEDEVYKKYNSLNCCEKKILEHVTSGKLNKVIAAELTISIKSVELNRSRLMKKMQVKSLAELVKAYMLLKSQKE